MAWACSLVRKCWSNMGRSLNLDYHSRQFGRSSSHGRHVWYQSVPWKWPIHSNRGKGNVLPHWGCDTRFLSGWFPTNTCVDRIPVEIVVTFLTTVKYVPSWLPGAGFQTKAKEGRKWATALKDTPFKALKEEMVNEPSMTNWAHSLILCQAKGQAKPSFGSFALQNIDTNADAPLQESIISAAAGTAFGGKN